MDNVYLHTHYIIDRVFTVMEIKIDFFFKKILYTRINNQISDHLCIFVFFFVNTYI
jgi:hypothetical protein